MNAKKNTRKETACSKFKHTWQAISRMYNTEAAAYGSTIAIGYFLLNIDSKEGIYGTDLAPLLGMEPTSLSRMVKNLEDDKLITRKPDKDDKRKVKIILTEKGKARKETAKNIVRNFNALVLDKIGMKRMEEFFKTADIIMQLAEQRSEEFKNS